MKILAFVLLTSCAACSALDPRLPPVEPPPNPVPGQLLVALPEAMVERIAQPTVQRHLRDQFAALYKVAPEKMTRILDHQVLIGMTSQEVVWAFQAHPTRVRDQGPPGGHTLLWQPDRYWVRIDANGRAISAGRY